MLRAGPLSNERVCRLINRRFVPIAFDLSNRGFLADAAARDFVVKARPAYGGRSVSTPKILLMTPAGEVVAEISNYAHSERTLAVLRDTLKKHPKFDAESDTESKLKGEARAEFRIDVLDDAGALEALGKIGTPRAHYLRGRIARWKGEFSAMDAHFAKVKDAALADDVRMERAYRHWHARDYAKLKSALAGFPKDSNRFSEATYYRGLALFHLDKKDEARKAWRKLIAEHAQDRWVYRADWAVCASLRKRSRGFSMMTGGRKSNSGLGRIGYMGARHPDLNR